MFLINLLTVLNLATNNSSLLLSDEQNIAVQFRDDAVGQVSSVVHNRCASHSYSPQAHASAIISYD